MNLAILILSSLVGLAVSLEFPLLWNELDFTDKEVKKEYLPKLKHALKEVGEPTQKLRVIQMWEKPELVKTEYSATYYDVYKRYCTLEWSVNEIFQSEVPSMPECSATVSPYGIRTNPANYRFSKNGGKLNNQISEEN